MKRFLSSIGRIFRSAAEIDKVLFQLSPEAKAAAVQTLADVLQFVAAADAAAAARGTNFTLDAEVLEFAKKLYSDAKRDIDDAKKIFAALGVAIPKAAKP